MGDARATSRKEECPGADSGIALALAKEWLDGLEDAYLRGDREAIMNGWLTHPKAPGLLLDLDRRDGPDREPCNAELRILAEVIATSALLRAIWVGKRAYANPGAGIFAFAAGLARAGFAEAVIRAALRDLCAERGWPAGDVNWLASRAWAAANG